MSFKISIFGEKFFLAEKKAKSRVRSQQAAMRYKNDLASKNSSLDNFCAVWELRFVAVDAGSRTSSKDRSLRAL